MQNINALDKHAAILRNVEFLPKNNDTENQEICCQVCQEALDAQSKNLVGHFNQSAHIFHAECLFPWQDKKGNCPTCRVKLISDFMLNKTPLQRGRQLLSAVFAQDVFNVQGILHEGPISMEDLQKALLLAFLDVDSEKDELVRQALITFVKRFYPTQPEILAVVIKKKPISWIVIGVVIALIWVGLLYLPIPTQSGYVNDMR